MLYLLKLSLMDFNWGASIKKFVAVISVACTFSLSYFVSQKISPTLTTISQNAICNVAMDLVKIY